ncbi:uncharacterized protein LOC128559016 [Mercenaria mercenaria]|uniref:uncharacterized protein LOC128559016 n=1 Tax=Mercenaria mercenaria TaxID=6596 RepID=UPI00234F0ADB|nr:uncharacterized protein LOC128559016 [Mercenaria mercenaria]
MSVQHVNNTRYPVQMHKKKLDFLRTGSFKGNRSQKKLRKSVSLPNTPLSEEFKFEVTENVIAETRTSVDKKTVAETNKDFKVSYAKRLPDEAPIVNNRSIDFAVLTRRGVSFVMVTLC